MISAPVFGIKRICVFIAVMLVGVTCFAADRRPKLIPLPPIVPGLPWSRLFSDPMVFQRDTQVKVWGWAASGEKVAVEFAGQTKSAGAEMGISRESLDVPPAPAEKKK